LRRRPLRAVAIGQLRKPRNRLPAPRQARTRQPSARVFICVCSRSRYEGSVGLIGPIVASIAVLEFLLARLLIRASTARNTGPSANHIGVAATALADALDHREADALGDTGDPFGEPGMA
jgi:hypothetical protein